MKGSSDCKLHKIPYLKHLFICQYILLLNKGSPIPEVKWFIDGSQLQNDGIKFCIYDDVDEFLGNVAVLEINYANETDEGEYVCTASNEEGRVYCSAELTIEGINENMGFFFRKLI